MMAGPGDIAKGGGYTLVISADTQFGVEGVALAGFVGLPAGALLGSIVETRPAGSAFLQPTLPTYSGNPPGTTLATSLPHLRPANPNMEVFFLILQGTPAAAGQFSMSLGTSITVGALNLPVSTGVILEIAGPSGNSWDLNLNQTANFGPGTDIPSGYTLTLDSPAVVTDGGILSVEGDLVNNSTIVTSGELYVNDGGQVDNSGIITVAAGGALLVDSTSTMNVNDGGELDVDGWLTINGTMNIAGSTTLDTKGHTLLIAGGLTGDSGSSIDVIGGGRALFADTSGFSGSIGSSDDTSYNLSPVVYTSNTTVSSGSSLNGEDVVALGCTLTVNDNTSPASMTVIGGTLAGTGTISGQLALADATLTKPVGASTSIMVEGTVYLDGDNVDSSATINIDRSDTDLVASGTLSCTITGLAAPRIDGSLTLTGDNSFTGTVVVGAGQTLTVSNDSALGAATNALYLQGTGDYGNPAENGTFAISANVELNSERTVIVDDNSTVFIETNGYTLTEDGMVENQTETGTATIIVDGYNFGGVLALTNDGNTFAGTFAVVGGALIEVGGSASYGDPALGAAGNVLGFTDASGIIADHTMSIGDKQFVAPGGANDPWDFMIINTNGYGILSDYAITGGGIFVTGGGNLTLGLPNTYEGPTYVDAGTYFQIDDPSYLLGANIVEVYPGGTMVENFATSYTDPSSVTHTLTSDVTLAGPGTYTLENGQQVTLDDETATLQLNTAYGGASEMSSSFMSSTRSFSESAGGPLAATTLPEKFRAHLVAINAEAKALDPGHSVHSQAIWAQVYALDAQVQAAYLSLQNASESAIDAAISQIVQNAGHSAAAASLTWSGGVSNPNDDSLISFENLVDKYFETYNLA
jgi:autotransporter-associated beta strand protein